ncbi:MAG: hypothetical protein WC465_01875 [Patescibacteria group bacterium]
MEENQTPMTSPLPTQKFISLGELFSLSFQIYKTKFGKLVGMSLLPIISYIPMGIVIGLFALVIAFSGTLGQVFSVILYIIFGLLGLASIIVVIYVSLASQVGLYLMVKDQYPDKGIWETFKAARPMIWDFFITNLTAGVFILLWTLLLIIPGIIMSVYYSFVAWVFINEGLKDMAAMRRSKYLVKGRWWGVLWRNLVPMLILMIVFGFLGGIFAPNPADRTREQIYSQISNILSMVIAPFFLAYSYNMYKSLVSIKGNNPQA